MQVSPGSTISAGNGLGCGTSANATCLRSAVPVPVGRVHGIADAADPRIDVLHVEVVEPLLQHDVVPLSQRRAARLQVDPLLLLRGRRHRTA